jgi:DNA-binding protein HU-beta
VECSTDPLPKALRQKTFRLQLPVELHTISALVEVIGATTTPHQSCFRPPIVSFQMNKADLVNLVAARTELTKTDVSMVVDAAIDTIIDSVVEGKKVSILGFGSFEPRERSARQGLNPKTGEKIAIPAKRVPAFTAGKMFKDRVQG